MQIFEAGQKFTMSYATYDQNASLPVAFSIYDVTTGSAVFVTKVPGVVLTFGVYSAQYLGLAGKTYLVIGAVYTDETYTVLQDGRGPTCDTYQAKNVGLVDLYFSYGVYSRDDSLFLRALVYDVTTTPILSGTVDLTSVFAGVYFGRYTGTLNHNYEVPMAVYTDSNYAEVDPNYAPACEDFSSILLSGVTLVLDDAILTAQSTSAILEADNCVC